MILARKQIFRIPSVLPIFCLICASILHAQDPEFRDTLPADLVPDWRKELRSAVEATFPPPRGMTQLARLDRVWVSPERNLVVVDGFFCLEQGQLEFFACPYRSKEHESVASLYCESQLVHAALLASGAQAGQPAAFEPYVPASGSTIRIEVFWQDDQKTMRNESAQFFIRHAGTDQQMRYDWVFAGSRFVEDPRTNEPFYLANEGELVCVSNFTSATMDIAVRSVDSNVGLLFEAFASRMPPQKTPVRLVMRPVNAPPFTGDGNVDLTAPDR